ncbi:uncharacterized, partial [Tachysurus ichikawai]
WHLVPGREAETWTCPKHIRHFGSGLLRDTKKIDVLSLAAHILCELIRVTRQLRQEAEGSFPHLTLSPAGGIKQVLDSQSSGAEGNDPMQVQQFSIEEQVASISKTKSS